MSNSTHTKRIVAEKNSDKDGKTMQYMVKMENLRNWFDVKTFKQRKRPSKIVIKTKLNVWRLIYLRYIKASLH